MLDPRPVLVVQPNHAQSIMQRLLDCGMPDLLEDTHWLRGRAKALSIPVDHRRQTKTDFCEIQSRRWVAYIGGPRINLSYIVFANWDDGAGNSLFMAPCAPFSHVLVECSRVVQDQSTQDKCNKVPRKSRVTADRCSLLSTRSLHSLDHVRPFPPRAIEISNHSQQWFFFSLISSSETKSIYTCMRANEERTMLKQDAGHIVLCATR